MMAAALCPFFHRSHSSAFRSRLHSDVASAADNHASAGVICNRNQGDVLDEIDVKEERLLAFRKMSFCAEEAVIERLSAGAVDRRAHVLFVSQLQSAYFDLPAVAQPFHRGVLRCFHHNQDIKFKPGVRLDQDGG